MKLTEEQILEMRDKFCELSTRSTAIQKDWEDFAEWLERNIIPPLEPNTTRWYHCSERLPTKEDADDAGEVAVLRIGGFWSSPWNNLDSADEWWTPAPKNLVKPTPPFEVWWKANKNTFIADEAPMVYQDMARFTSQAAFEAGKAQPKQ